MKPQAKWFVALTILAVPMTSRGCEPIFPLVQLLGGSTLAGPLLFMHSLAWLAAAVAIKCAAFAFFERRFSWRRAVVFMVLANAVSTIPGFLIAVLTGSLGIVLSLPVVCLLGVCVGKRLSRIAGSGQKSVVTAPMAALAFIGFSFLSVLLFAKAESALADRGFPQYWILKFLFVTLVACTGILMSAVLEKTFIAFLSRKSHAHSSFYTSVVRANYITLAIVLFVAALEMLPRRLNAPHSIVSWLHALSIAFGLA